MLPLLVPFNRWTISSYAIDTMSKWDHFIFLLSQLDRQSLTSGDYARHISHIPCPGDTKRRYRLSAIVPKGWLSLKNYQVQSEIKRREGEIRDPAFVLSKNLHFLEMHIYSLPPPTPPDRACLHEDGHNFLFFFCFSQNVCSFC